MSGLARNPNRPVSAMRSFVVMDDASLRLLDDAGLWADLNPSGLERLGTPIVVIHRKADHG